MCENNQPLHPTYEGKKCNSVTNSSGGLHQSSPRNLRNRQNPIHLTHFDLSIVGSEWEPWLEL